MSGFATRQVDLFTTRGRIRTEVSLRGLGLNEELLIEKARIAAGVSPEEFRRGEVVPRA